MPNKLDAKYDFESINYVAAGAHNQINGFVLCYTLIYKKEKFSDIGEGMC